MKIKRIETYSTNSVCVVKVSTDDGCEGYGQTAPYHANITALVLHQQLSNQFLGAKLEKPEEIGPLVEKSILSQYKFPWSYTCRAAGGIELALWDLFGKKEGVSVCELIGGKPQPIPIYGSSMRRDISPVDEATRLQKLASEKGIRAFKIRIGAEFGLNRDVFPGRTEQVVSQVRQKLGDSVDLYVDANSAYTPEKAVEVGEMLESHGVCHYEEPCPFPELEWTAHVTESVNIPVSGGEQDNDMAHWRRMIKMSAVNIVQPDICYIGGLSRALQVAGYAGKAGLICTPHAANRSLVSVATAHLMSAIQNAGKYMEFSIEADSFCEHLFTSPLQVEDGAYVISAHPGWGVRFNPEWLKKADFQLSALQV
ncbi:MAG: mandelate racemase/muconate lactonizing enzyme family protein [Verrucomicrobia bacterium]|nr:mandelate racemase/muconate lactonizing enzyme family protein [Verrucomicrobiota bacterium]MCH8511315.1 mandelate racemase/muconate lactonizing enzyme family protein [Kiritimatiellia bacterium]